MTNSTNFSNDTNFRHEETKPVEIISPSSR